MEIAVITIFVAFLLVNLALGLYQGKNVRTTPEYILGRGFTTSALLLTFTGTLIGGNYVVGWFTTGSIFGGATLFLWVGATVAMGLVATFYIFPKLRKFKGWYTLGDIVQQAYGSLYAQLLVDGIALISSVLLLSAQLVVLKSLAVFLGFAKDDPIVYLLVFFFTLVVVAYASRAGTPGVVTTDVLQMILVLGGIAFIGYRVLDLDLGHIRIQGLADLWQQVKTIENTNPLRHFFQKDPGLIPITFSSIGTGLILFTPAFIKRVGMASDERQLKHSMLGFLIVWVLFMLMILVSSFGLYVVRGVKGVIPTDQVYPILLKIAPYGWMRILLVTMVLAAVMSTADSVLTATSVLAVRFMTNVRHRQQPFTEPTIGSLRVANLVVGAFSLVLAFLFMQGKHPAFDFDVFSRALLGALMPCIVGISMGIKKSSKALIGAMAFFGLCLLCSLVADFAYKVVDFSFLDPNWNLPDYPIRWRYRLFLPFITFLSCLAYLLFEAMVHSGLKWEEKVRFEEKKPNLLQRGWLEIKKFWATPLRWAEERVDSYEGRPVLLTLFCIFSFLTSNFIGQPVPAGYLKSVMVLMLGVFSLCALLLTHEQWYSLPKRYFAFFWLFSVVFCLPFAFLLQYFYHPTMLTSFYLLLIPFLMRTLAGGNLDIVLSFLGYVVAFGVWKLTFHAALASPDRWFTLLGLGFVTVLSRVALGGLIESILGRANRPKLWASSWGHDLNHLFMEVQMEVSQKFNPLPKDEKARLKEAEKRLANMEKYVGAGVAQSKAFRQLIVQDTIRASEMVSMGLNEIVRHVYDTLKNDFQQMVTINGKATSKVRVFLPLFTNILTNLIRNAYSAGATKVELEWDEKIPILYIKNNGQSIAKDRLGTLFEHNANRNGNGIGLPFVKEALHKMGALIDVESDNKGSVFMILLEKA